MRGCRGDPGDGTTPASGGSGGVRGFTLVELLAALLVLEMGLVGVAGLALVAGRALSEAALRERAVAGASSVADSLARARPIRSGESPFAGSGRLVWVEAGRPGDGLVLVRIAAEGPDGRTLLEVDAVVESAADEDDGPADGDRSGGRDGR